MGLPFFIEYLLTLQRPAGGHLLNAGFGTIIIPIFPPNTSITYSSTPQAGTYALIQYGLYLSPSMVPGAFSGWAQQWGALQFRAILTATWLRFPADTYIVITNAQPSLSSATNRTNVAQYFESVSPSLVIRSEEDYEQIREAVEHTATSAKAERLAVEANRFLKVMAGPKPPLEGS